MVGRDGFEPSKAKPTDLQSVAFDRSATYPYATVILVVILLLLTISWVEYYCDWSWWSESNQQPIDYKSIALPLSHTSILKKCPTFYQNSNQTFGALGRNRTTDTRIFSPLLYRLSYQGLRVYDVKIVMATWKRLELSTSAVTGRRSNQLNYQAIRNFFILFLFSLFIIRLSLNFY